MGFVWNAPKDVLSVSEINIIGYFWSALSVRRAITLKKRSA